MEATIIQRSVRAGLSAHAGCHATVPGSQILECETGVVAKGGHVDLQYSLVSQCRGAGVWASHACALTGTHVRIVQTNVTRNGGDGVKLQGRGASVLIGNGSLIQHNEKNAVLVLYQAFVRIKSATVESASEQAIGAVVVIKGQLDVRNSTLSAVSSASGCVVVLYRVHGDENTFTGNVITAVGGVPTMQFAFAYPDSIDIAAMRWDWVGFLRHHALNHSAFKCCDVMRNHACMLVRREVLSFNGEHPAQGQPNPDRKLTCWEITDDVRQWLECFGAAGEVDDAQLLQIWTGSFLVGTLDFAMKEFPWFWATVLCFTAKAGVVITSQWHTWLAAGCIALTAMQKRG